MNTPLAVIRQGVRSIAKAGAAKLFGDVTLSPGSNVTLTQSGQNIEIASTGGGGAGSTGPAGPAIFLLAEDGEEGLMGPQGPQGPAGNVGVTTRCAVRVTNSTNQTIASAAWTPLAFDTERYDTDNLHSTVTNNTRITFRTAGKYILTGDIEFNSGAGTARGLSILKNGATFIAVDFITPTGGGFPTTMSIATQHDFIVGDYVELQGWQNTGGLLAVNSSAQYSPEFAAQIAPDVLVGQTGAQGPEGPQGDPGDEGPMGPPGFPGISGATGAQGALGPAIFLTSEDGEAGSDGPPGVAGAAGPTGAQGPIGPAIFLEAESIDGDPGVPGPMGPQGPAGAAGAPGTGSAAAPVVFFPEDDDFESFTQPPGGPHVITHQADGSDPFYIEKAPDANVIVPAGYGFVVVGPYDLTSVTLTLEGDSSMVIL